MSISSLSISLSLYIYICIHVCVCVYIYIYSHGWNRNTRPQPVKFRKLVFSDISQLILHLSKLIIWGSSWGLGVPISLVRASVQQRF